MVDVMLQHGWSLEWLALSSSYSYSSFLSLTLLMHGMKSGLASTRTHSPEHGWPVCQLICYGVTSIYLTTVCNVFVAVAFFSPGGTL